MMSTTTQIQFRSAQPFTGSTAYGGAAHPLTSQGVGEVGHAATTSCLGNSLCKSLGGGSAGRAAAGQGLTDGSGNSLGLSLSKSCRTEKHTQL